MCGIFCLFGNPSQYDPQLLLGCSKKLRHRGPDWSGVWKNDICHMYHERLSIIGVTKGHQPITSTDENYILSVNGEIYNYKELKEQHCQNYNFTTDSDCEVIIPLYIKYGAKCVDYLDGIFAFCLYDMEKAEFFICRDRIGINPMYYCFNKMDNTVIVASEAKSLQVFSRDIEQFMPGVTMTFKLNGGTPSLSNTSNYFDMTLFSKFDRKLNEPVTLSKIKKGLIEAVDKRLMSEVPFGVLLSGGLDSSLIASITAKIMKEHPDRFSFGNKLHTFSIGLDGGPDLKFARIVADHIGSIHHEFNFNIEDGINSIYDIIHHLETYDVTTIRASIPMYLLSRKIKAMGIKMVLSGEGADEILGGYLYFHQAPNATEFHNECVTRVADLHNFDCLRANKSTMAWGLEVRVPFLDVAFVNDALPIHPELKYKNGIEKNVLRQAFEDNDYDYLPSKILWRQKEQFSDGVGYNWIDSIKRHATDAIDDATFDTMKENFPDVTTKEEAYYRQIFNEQFHSNSSFVKRWVPKMSWEGVSYDPSGRAQKVHLNATV